jgi:hypothetical protein
MQPPPPPSEPTALPLHGNPSDMSQQMLVPQPQQGNVPFGPAAAPRPPMPGPAQHTQAAGVMPPPPPIREEPDYSRPGIQGELPQPTGFGEPDQPEQFPADQPIPLHQNQPQQVMISREQQQMPPQQQQQPAPPQPQQPQDPVQAWAHQHPIEPMQSDPPVKPDRKFPMKVLIATIVGAVLILGSAGAFLYLTTKDKPSDRGTTNDAAQDSSQNAVAPDLSTLNMVAFNPPSDMKDYKANDLGVATVRDYTDPTGNCDLQFGTLTAQQLPGADLGEMLAPQIQAFREAGATITGPTAGEALTLKTATGDSYSMPTLNISFTKDRKNATSYYSAVIMKGGNRAFVSRSCINAEGAVDQNALKAVNDKAKQLTITPQ